MSEGTPLLATTAPENEPEEQVSTKERLGRRLESSTAHWLVIALTTLDAFFVLCDIAYDFLKDQRCICTDSCPVDPPVLEIFSLLSLGITCGSARRRRDGERGADYCPPALFLIEIPLSLYCFGSQHYTSVTQCVRPAPPRDERRPTGHEAFIADDFPLSNISIMSLPSKRLS